MSEASGQMPLEGLKVVDVATVIAGPTIGMLLGDFGADVLKVEHPRGDVLPKLSLPILVLNPEDDLYDYTRRAAPLLQDGRVHDLPGWSHGFLDIHTAEVAELLRAFLDTE